MKRYLIWVLIFVGYGMFFKFVVEALQSINAVRLMIPLAYAHEVISLDVYTTLERAYRWDMNILRLAEYSLVVLWVILTIVVIWVIFKRFKEEKSII